MDGLSLRGSDAAAERSRVFWRRALLAAPFTALPRWTLEPVAGVSAYEIRVPAELVAALRRLADDLAVSFGSVWLAAHAKVLGALAGEREVSAGYVVRRERPPLPCRLSIEPLSWRWLLVEAHRAELELRSYADFPFEVVERELGRTRRPFETVLDPTGSGGELDQAVLRVGFLERDGIVMKLEYRTDVLDAASAARIAGYHLAALESIAADPEAEHARQGLLSADELEYQIHGLAGPRRELPELPVHELFEAQVRAHPDEVAAIHDDREWSYRQLNVRANELASALLARGLRPEGVVAVAIERNLEWLATVLGIFKAGGAYLPVDPRYPADRIVWMLRQAGCRLVVTETGTSRTVERALEALPGVATLHVDAIHGGARQADNLGTRVSIDQLAYIFFTSGSTGEPKGAMCEHAGMVNHLFAKIHDLGLAEGDVVAQTAPMSFDISLWQLLAALLVGGRTLIVEQEAVLDPGRFVDRITAGRVDVFQVVPSHLEVLLAYLTRQPRDLPDLRCVSVTGEALKRELVQRWFAVQPATRLVNAYGLTETSDDTHHEIMDRVPEGERVPLGRPIHNVHCYVVDEHLAPVPLGAPGEIVLSGVCVGRGYVNDLERTRPAFLADPHRPGARLYRSGDHGCWLPDGKLAFLGRRDGQVRVNGFRIEIGEIENALAGSPGVRDGVVVVTGRADHNKRLVAFYSGERAVDAGTLASGLAASLPEYMVPCSYHWRSALPLTGNGKVDRKRLTELAAELEATAARANGAMTATERRLARAWADVLGIPAERIGSRDDFFALGGTSLSAVKLVVQLERAIGLKELSERPMLADMAAWLDDRSSRRSQNGSY